MSVNISVSGSFKNTFNFFDAMLKPRPPQELRALAQKGVDALRSATPMQSGLTAESWDYEIVQRARGSWFIYWTNSHIQDGVPIAIILQYGHGTGTGGYVQGQDYINPAIRGIMDEIADTAWKAVTSA